MTAWRKYAGTDVFTNCSKIASRPIWVSMICFGTLPLRNPGTLISFAIAR